MSNHNDQQSAAALGQSIGLGQVVAKYVLPYNTLLAFSIGIATLSNAISVWLLAGLALTLQALVVITLMLDGAFRYELVNLGKRSVAKNRRVGHLLRFLWPDEHARIYKAAPFWALLVITTGVSIYAAHNWSVEIDRIAAKKAEIAKRNTKRVEEGYAVGNPVLNISSSSAYVRAGSIIRRDEYGVLRFVLAESQIQQGILADDSFVSDLTNVKSSEVTAEIDCESGRGIREISINVFPEPNFAGSSRLTQARELYWRRIGSGKFSNQENELEKIVCAYHRPGEPMDDD